MGFLFDSLKHLLSSEPRARREALASMAGRVFGVKGAQLRHGALPDDAGYEVWHYRKAGARHPRGYAASLTVGLSEAQQRELIALTLADSRDPGDDRIAALVAAVAATGAGRGEVVSLPDGTLGRGSHTMALLTAPWPLPERDLPEYERVLGARLDLVVPVTAREARWIAEHGAEAFVTAMRDQQVAPWADRPPGQTALD